MKKVSVIIPCYNAGEFLNDAVQSALDQTWGNLEVIIVDDGSRDPFTLRLLQAPPWPRTRVFHQENAGPAAARNRAVREADGYYILPLDADDTIESGYVRKAVSVLEARPEVGCVYCKAMKFGAESGPWELPAYTLEELVIDNVIFVSGLYRKTDWMNVGGYDESLRHGVEDYDYWVKMVASGKEVVQLDEYLFNYRVQPKSRTTQFQDGKNEKVMTYAKIFRNNLDFFATHAEFLYKHRFGLYSQVDHWRSRYENTVNEYGEQDGFHCTPSNQSHASLVELLEYWQGRYGKFDAYLNRHPTLSKFIKKLRKVL